MRNTFKTALLLTCLCAGSLAAPVRADVVVIVSAQSPLKNLGAEQLSDIFLGKIATLPDGTRVVPVDLSEGAPTRTAFYAKYIGKTPSQVRAYWSKLIFSGKGHPPRSTASEEALRKLIAENPNCIGYVERESVDASVRALTVQGGT